MPSDCRTALVGRGLRVHRGATRVLEDVHIVAPIGAVTAIVGPNGAGKTTLLKALLGLLEVSAGEVVVLGQPLARLDRADRARRLAYVPQRSQLSAAMSVADVVAMGRALFGESRHAIGVAAEQAMHQAGVASLAQRRFPELSGGEQRLVLIARALCTGAPIILLDEPTSSLDIAHRLELCHRMRQLAAGGKAVVCVLHELDDARRFADIALVLQRGRAVACGPARAVLDEALVRAVYSVEMHPDGAPSFHRLVAT